MDCSPPGSSVYRNSCAGILEWVAISFSKVSSWPSDWTLVSFIVGDLHCRQVLYWLSHKWCSKEGLVPKTHSFWIVVLENTLKGRLDGKEIKTLLNEINPEDLLEVLLLKLKLQSFDNLMWRADSLQKTWMLGKIEGRRRRGWQRMRWLDGITDLMDMSLSKL